ncbi:chemotaxis protein CheW [Deltaproteobacteria bacterium TL4]
MQLATFHIGDELFAVNILLTKEIGKIHELTAVPESPEYVVGLMNLRGQILTIIDFQCFLEPQQNRNDNGEKQLIILKTKSELEPLQRHGLVADYEMTTDPMALVIDKIGDVLTVENDDIAPAPSNLVDARKELVSGVVQLDERLVILLSVERLVKKFLSSQPSKSSK